MQGRIFGIKKSYILIGLLVLLSSIFLATTLLTILVFNLYYLWFFIFCLCCGLYQFAKGILFKFDSCFYFGVLLLFVGGIGFYVTFSGENYFQSVYYILAFASASYFTFVFFNQKFQLYIAILLYFATLFWFLAKIKIISIPIFLALILTSVLLFILIYTFFAWISRKRSAG